MSCNEMDEMKAMLVKSLSERQKEEEKDQNWKESTTFRSWVVEAMLKVKHSAHDRRYCRKQL